jgi:hypothetical protein
MYCSNIWLILSKISLHTTATTVAPRNGICARTLLSTLRQLGKIEVLGDKNQILRRSPRSTMVSGHREVVTDDSQEQQQIKNQPLD